MKDKETIIPKVPTAEYNCAKFLLRLRLSIHLHWASLPQWKVVLAAVPAKSRHRHQIVIDADYHHHWNHIGSGTTADSIRNWSEAWGLNADGQRARLAPLTPSKTEY